MRKLDVSQIIDAVRTKIDEIGLNESVMAGTDQDDMELDKVISSCIPDAYRFVVLNADISLLEGIQHTGTVEIDDRLVGHILIPNKLLRVVSARLSSWQSSSDDVINDGSPEYRMQSDKYACGTPEHPVVALVQTSQGRKLEFYKAKSKSDTLDTFVYIPTVSTTDKTINIADQLYEAFIYYIAGLTLTTFRDDLSPSLFNIAKQLIGIEG